MLHRRLTAKCLAVLALASVLAMPTLVRAQADPASLGPFPAQAMAWTPADKEAQRQAGEKLIHDLQAAVAAGEKTFVIPKGDYRFAKASQPSTIPMGYDPVSSSIRELVFLYGSPKLPAFITVEGAQDLTIDGSGSTLWFEETNTALLLNQCRHVTVKNLAIDYDPLPFIQGKIVAIHLDSGEVDVEFDPAYLDPRSLAMNPEPRPYLRGIAFDPVTRRLKADQGNFNVPAIWPNKVGPNTYRIKPNIFQAAPLQDLHLAVGDLLALWRVDLIYGKVLRLENCADMVLEDVSIYAGGMTAIQERFGVTQTTYRHDNVIRRPGTSRLLSCNGDALSILTCMAGPLVEQCRMEYSGDDFINPHAWYTRALVQESPTVVVAEELPHPSFGVGTDVMIYDPRGYRFIGQRRIVACAPTQWTAQKGAPTLLKVDEKLPWTPRNVFLIYDLPVEAQRLTFDQPIDLPENALFAYPQFNNPGTLIRDCDFTGTPSRGILIRSPHAQLLNNRFHDTAGAAISVDGELGSNIYGEANYPTDVLIQNNHITHCAMFAGVRLPQATLLINTPKQEHNPAHPDNVDGWIGDVRVIDNVLEDNLHEAIRVLCARDITLRGNTITGYNQVISFKPGADSSAPDLGNYQGVNHGIVLDHVVGLTLENNTLTQPGPVSQGEYFRNEITPAP